MAVLAAGARIVYDQVGSRVAHAARLPTNVIDLTTAVGVAALGASSGLITVGNSQISPILVRMSSGSIDRIIRTIYMNLLGTLNPRAVNNCDGSLFNPPRGGYQPQPQAIAASRIQYHSTSPNLRDLAHKQQRTLDELNQSVNWFDKHVTVRVRALATTTQMVTTAIVLMLLGAVAALFSIACLGLNSSFNSFAYANVAQVGFIFNQLYNGALGIIRPGLLS